MRAARVIGCLALGVVTVATAVASCGGPEPIGSEPCTVPSPAPDAGVFAYSPALECSSRLCLVERGLSSAAPDAAVAVCTRECVRDSDCDTPERLACATGYVCSVVAGHAHAVCVCRAALDGGG